MLTKDNGPRKLMRRRRDYLKAFLTRVNKNGPIIRDELGPCWEWTGAKHEMGYGRVFYHGMAHMTHRVSWMMEFGVIPEGMFICHKCDNRLCVRPDHLFMGTQADNMADCVAKGRQARGDRHYSVLYPDRVPRGPLHQARARATVKRGDEHHTHLRPETVPRGAKHYTQRPGFIARKGCEIRNSKLTDDDVRAIRREFASGVTKRQIAERFGVSRFNIHLIVTHKTWRHLEG